MLAGQLDADATASLVERTSGLHGYLRFEKAGPRWPSIADDPEQAAFVHDAARYYQVFDAASGRLLFQSDALRPLGLQFTPSEVRAFGNARRFQDCTTDLRACPALELRALAGGWGQLPSPGRRFARGGGPDARAVPGAAALGVPAGLVAAALAGWWMAGIALVPLSRLAAAARSIDVSDLAQRLPVRGAGDELDEVATGSTTLSTASNGRWARCGSSAPRWRTSCAHR